MRLFEVTPDEVVGAAILTITLDLDTIVMFQETPYEGDVLRNVYLANGYNISLTKAGFDRLMREWKSR